MASRFSVFQVLGRLASLGGQTSGLLSHSIRSSVYRCLSTTNIQVEHEGPVAMVTMNKQPVNALSVDFLQEIVDVVHDLENTKTCRGMILMSGAKVYSAGLELKDIQNPPKDILYKHFWNLQEVYMRLYGSPLAVVSAMTGHAVAGGCLLALCADYRVLAQGCTIGLTEVQLGFMVPYWLKDMMVSNVGFHAAEKAIQRGELYNADDALKIGLVDEVVVREDVVRVATENMKKVLQIPDEPRIIMKEMMRKPIVDALQKVREVDAETFTSQVIDETAQRNLGKYLENLKNRKTRN